MTQEKRIRRPEDNRPADKGSAGDTPSVTRDVAAVLPDVDRGRAPGWRDDAMTGVDYLAAQGRPFTAYDVARLGVGEPDHPNRWGALMAAAHRAGTIVPVAVVRGDRKPSHRSYVNMWVGAEHATRRAGGAR